jgi:uncharacterized damage-inducible protein DinB
MALAQSMLAEFEQEAKTTRKILERLPEDKLTWRPHEKSLTAGQLAYHIAEVPEQVLRMGLEDVFSMPNMGNPQPKSVAEVLAMPRAAFYRSILLNHWYHHRGQFGVYLRLVGAKVPSSYGPSGDEMPDFMAA